MEEKTESHLEAKQMSGEGTISGPGASGKSKVPFIIAGVVFVTLLTTGALVMQNKAETPTIQPTPIGQDSQPIKMETFSMEEAQNRVTSQNVQDVIMKNQVELEYGLDQNSFNDSVIDIFSRAF